MDIHCRWAAILPFGLLAVGVRSGAAPADPWLDRRIDCSFTRVSLLRAAQEVGACGGVPLTAATGDRGERPFQVFIRRATEGAVMDELARFVPTQPGSAAWERVAIGTKRGYRLVEDVRSRTAHRSLLRRLAKERVERLQSDMDTAFAMADLGPEDLQRAAAAHPELAFFMSSLRRSLALYRSLAPDLQAAVLNGRPVTLPFRELSPGLQRLMASAVGDQRFSYTHRRPDGTEVSMRWDSRDLPKTFLTVHLSNQPDRPGIQLFIPTLPGAGMGWPDILHPPTVSERDRPEWMRKAYEKRDASEKERRQEWARKAAGEPDLRKVVTIRHELERPDPQHPGKTVRKLAVLEFVLEQIADQSRLSIIGDYDPCWDDYYSWQDFHRPGLRLPQYLRADLARQPLWMALEAVESAFAVSIEKHGRFLWVRSPRVPYAEIDGIDLLDDRPAPPPRGFPDDDVTKS